MLFFSYSFLASLSVWRLKTNPCYLIAVGEYIKWFRRERERERERERDRERGRKKGGGCRGVYDMV
jgi:hypothetical protein